MVVVLAGAAGLLVSQIALPSAKAADSVQAWEASANSAVVGISPSASGVFLTSTIGQAYAAYDQSETQATSALVNLGGLGYAVASSPVCGLALSLSQQPQLLTADSANGPSSKTTQAQLAPGVNTPSGTGTERVTVSPNPESAEARTYPVTQNVPGIVDVEGVAQSEVHYVDGHAQAASSSVSETLSLLGGLVKFNGLTWDASQQRSSGNPTNSAAFSFSSISISGAGLPIDIPGTVPIATALSVVNGVLGVLGVSVAGPSESVDPGTGGVSMSSLQVHFSGSTVDNQLVGPLTGPVTQIVNLINGQVTNGADCSDLKNLLGQLTTIPETGLGLLLSAFSGSGAMDLYFGGATADTIAAPLFSNPFDINGSAGATPLPPVGVSGLSASTATTGAPAASSGLEATGAGPLAVVPPSTSVAPVAQRPAATVALVRCTTTNAGGGSGCWRGLATWAAGAVVVLGGGLLAADAVYGHRGARTSRRRRRFLP